MWSPGAYRLQVLPAEGPRDDGGPGLGGRALDSAHVRAKKGANSQVRALWIIEFLVDGVDRVYGNLTGFVADFVNEPTTMPWGNRSLLFRDPDGNLVNFFAPVTPAAIAKFASY
ncbi:VOC family protein [Streptomyces sp. NRRL B-24720]|uniref:VOC family protein n=1 Tax=Streptomyces sp. NRRL B-24720 TaxID=1476876 RepID=UPI000B09CF0B|nr:VOC family protein [Streptomyces sp. NRRL B-24720]